MVIKSEYLNMEFTASVYEKTEGNKVLSIISHDSLTDIVDRQMPREIMLNYNFEFCEGLGYPAFICTMTDKTGRRVTTTGSARDISLDTNISKNFPVEMAEKRAFDRAVIKFLALPKKFYGSAEISVFDTNPDHVIKSKTETAPEPEKAEEKLVPCRVAPEEQPVPITIEEEETVEAGPVDHGNYVLDFGLYKNTGKTIKEIANVKGTKGLEWLKAVQKYLKGRDKEEVDTYLSGLQR